MKVISLSEQGGKKKNEDALLISNNIYGVFDGATSFVELPVESEYTGGYIASNIAAKTFGEDFTTLHDAAIVTNNRIWDAMMQADINTQDKLSLWSTSACVIKVHDTEFEWLQIGDSIPVIIYKDGSYKLLVEGYDHDERDLVEWKKRSESGEKNVFDAMKEEFFFKTRKGMNEAGGYGIINGEEKFEEYLLEGVESLDQVAHILIFSDGMFFPTEDPTQPDDIDRIVQTYIKFGVEGWHGAVRSEEESDPECKKYPRLKKSDDATAIVISF